MLWLCFTLSGAAALALEMLWMRSAALVLGRTAATTSTVLACYFAGLACGAAAASRVQRRPIRVYGLLELAGAAGVGWSWGVFHWLASDAAQAWLAAHGAVAGVVAIAAAVLPTTTCLGATLPALGQVLAASNVGSRGGLLYALNTLGGAVGAAAAGFGMPALVGVSTSYVIAAAISALVGMVALAVGARTRATILATTPLNRRPRVSRGRLRLVAAGIGALGLGLEVLWTRLFAQVLHNSVYSFTAIALVFIVALAFGAVLAAWFLRGVHGTPVAAAALIGSGIATIAGIWLFVYLTNGLDYVGMQRGLREYLLRIVLLAAATAGPGAIGSGAAMVALWSIWGERDGAARPLGDLSAANTLGGIAGAIGVGFVAIPHCGLRGTLLAIAVIYLILAPVIANQSRIVKRVVCAALLAVAFISPMQIPLTKLHSDTETLRAMFEDPNGIVTVVDTTDDLQLRLDNFYVLGDSAAATNERRLGLLPLLLHPGPQRAAFIGLATGTTASAGPALDLAQTTVIEVVPEVARAARAYFSEWNGGLLEQPHVRLVLDDGRRYLAASRAQYDVIVADLFVPWHAGAGNLYSREMYQTALRRLAPGGLFCQWLPLYQLTRDEFDMIAHTFLGVFPHVSLWRADFYPNRPVVGLIGRLSDQPISLEQVSRRIDRLPAWARDRLLAAPQGLVMLYAGNLSSNADLFADAPVNTDDRPQLEFIAPRLTRITAGGDKDWFTGEALAAFYDALDARTAHASPFVPDSDEMTAARRAGVALYKYALASAQHNEAAAQHLQAEVVDLVPQVVGEWDSNSEVTQLTDARRHLDDLRSQQTEIRQRVDELEQRLKQLSNAERIQQ